MDSSYIEFTFIFIFFYSNALLSKNNLGAIAIGMSSSLHNFIYTWNEIRQKL